MSQARPPWSASGQGSVPDLTEMATAWIRWPLMMFAAGMDMFGQGVRVMQETGTRVVSSAAPPPPPPGPPVAAPFTAAPPAAPAAPPAAPATASSAGTAADVGAAQASRSETSNTATNPVKENDMSDTNLADDKVKLVSYSIACITRGHEHVLNCDNGCPACNQCTIVTENLSDCDFETTVIADYVEKCCKKGKSVGCKSSDLRVVYQVLGRWEKQDLHYEEKQLHILAGIQHAITDCCDDDSGKPKKILAKK